MRAGRRAQGARPRGVRHANSLRVPRGGACPRFLTRYDFAAIPGFANHALNFVAETESTNTDLKNDWKSAVFSPRILVANHQRDGRGQFSRPWKDNPGKSLLFSFSWEFSTAVFFSLPIALPLLTGIALHRAILETVSGHENPSAPLWLKWPNDLLVGERKLAGILVESTFFSQLVRVVVGVGVNLEGTLFLPIGSDPTSFPPISLEETGVVPSSTKLLFAILSEWYKVVLAKGNPVDLEKEFVLRSRPMWEKKWLVTLPSGKKLRGKAVGLAPQGFLLFRSDEDGQTFILKSAVRLSC